MENGLHGITPVNIAFNKESEGRIIDFYERVKDSSEQIKPAAKELYDLLIQPVESVLKAADTLVIVPDGLLRKIPFAALHDGQQYLAERFVLASIPALGLTDLSERKWADKKVFLSGLSAQVREFSPLPFVCSEVDAIKSLYKTNALLEDNFTKKAFNKQVREKKTASIVHIASHGQFSRDSKKSFLLTYPDDNSHIDDNLRMKDLEQLAKFDKLRGNPVELLTLSACESAAGEDDKAELGLAGIAVKAGTKSAVASLWRVNDQATCYLMERFYNHLKISGYSPAKALQAAQIALLRGTKNANWKHCRMSRCEKASGVPSIDPDYSHPSYWAPFLLIGSWL